MRLSNGIRISGISLGHLINDWYLYYFQILLPFFVITGMSVQKGSFLISAFAVTSSLSQPYFGYLVDQKNQRWMIYTGTLWMAVLLGLVGIVSSYPFLIAIAVLAGFGSAIFHPQASSLVGELSAGRKGLFQAVFIASGNAAWAFTPLIVAPVVLTYGLSITPVFILPGILAALVLWMVVPKESSRKKTYVQPPSIRSICRNCGKELSKILTLEILRALSFAGIIAFLPMYLTTQKIPLVTGNRFLFVMLLCGAAGNIVGGFISDKIGRKKVIIASLVGTTLFLFLFLQTSGALQWIFMALAGTCLLASYSVTVVLTQELLHENAAMASGLILGFAMGVGGLGVSLFGTMIEYWGISIPIYILISLPLFASIFGCLLKAPGDLKKEVSP